MGDLIMSLKEFWDFKKEKRLEEQLEQAKKELWESMNRLEELNEKFKEQKEEKYWILPITKGEEASPLYRNLMAYERRAMKIWILYVSRKKLKIMFVGECLKRRERKVNKGRKGDLILFCKKHI